MLIKKIFKTLLIIIGILLAIAAICIGVMAIFPSVSIFGFYFVNEDYKSNKIEITNDLSNLSNILLETDKYNIEIVRDDLTEGAYLMIESRYVGLVKENEQGKLVKNTAVYRNLSDKTLNIYTEEPEGLVIPMSTKITLILGLEQPTVYVNPILELPLNKIDVKVGSGDVKVTTEDDKYFSFNSLSLEKPSTHGRVNLEGIKVKNKVELNFDYGQLDLTNVITKDITNKATADVDISTKFGSFTFDSVKSLNVKDGTAPYIHVKNNIESDLRYKSKTGTLIVEGKVGSILNSQFSTFNVNSDGAKLEIGTLISDIIIWNYSDNSKPSENTSLKLGQLGIETQLSPKKRIINLENGEVSIKKIFENNPIEIETKRGDITLGELDSIENFVSSNVKTKTQNGATNVYFDALPHVFELTSTYGVINANNLNPSSEALSTIKNNDSSTINANFLKINNPVLITGYNKNINITVPADGEGEKVNYKLLASAGSITVNLDIRQLENYWMSAKNKIVNSHGVDYQLTVNPDNTIDTALTIDESSSHYVNFKYENPYLVSYNSDNPLLEIRSNAGNIYINEKI